MDQKSLEEKLNDWLIEQGYPLEMEVALAFRGNNFRVSQSAYYTDPETGVPREIDVLARCGFVNRTTFGSVTFAIECKVSKKKPWVVFTQPNEIVDENYVNWYCASERAWQYIVHASIRGKFEKLPLTFHQRKRIGYGVTQAFTSAEDVPYKALHSAVRCAIEMTKRSEKSKMNAEFIDIIIPVVAIDGDLFETYLDEDNQLVCSKVTESVILWDAIISDKKSLAVHIVTREALGKFAAAAWQTADFIANDWKKNLVRIFHEMDNLFEENNRPPKKLSKPNKRGKTPHR